ncbi:hypothetical protein [Clostridium grantii]|uniref:Uncharacterized protein n=1 Tax=Clostridium grantii DSM 8605 TaxID=1121316 RepID=A0A1M5UIE7_9CLOT|nr:hypothetical protein [Clostridium grantii]SHH62596.1 hypothetical protein SAMN02745207_01747 [Clostridium grantii DSM 8605]
MYNAPHSPKKATKKNNDNKSDRLNPNSKSYEMTQKGMVNRVDAPNNTTKNNKSK